MYYIYIYIFIQNLGLGGGCRLFQLYLTRQQTRSSHIHIYTHILEDPKISNYFLGDPAVRHSRNVCCVTQQTCLLCDSTMDAV